MTFGFNIALMRSRVPDRKRLPTLSPIPRLTFYNDRYELPAQMPLKGRTMNQARVGILMGSDSDLEVMRAAGAACEEFRVPYEMRVISAHRTPQDTADYAQSALMRGLE